MTEQCIEEEALYPRKRPRVSRSDSEDDILNEALSELGDSAKRCCFEEKEDVYQNLEPSEQIKSPPKNLPPQNEEREARYPGFPLCHKKIVERTHARQLALDKKAEQIGLEKMGMIRQPMKRLRGLQSESGDNKEEVHSVSQDSSKRCCYEVVGDENLNPKEKMLSPSKSCRRFAEMEVKPDTPALTSVKTRMNKLATLRRQWDSQDDADCPSPVYSSSHTPAALQVKLVSKPVVSNGRMGRLADLASAIGSWEDDFSTPSKKCNTGKELLVESVVQPVLESPSKHEDYEDIQGLPDEGNEDSELRHSVTDSNAFRSVLEKFESNPRQGEPSPASHRPRSLSSSTRAIQERLLNDTTPSLSMASLLRKEREEELSLVRMQPNKENLWLRKNGAGSGFRETIGTEESKLGKQETLDSSSKYHLNQSVDKVEVSSIEVKLCSFSGESLLISEDGVDSAGEVEKEELTEKGFRSLKKVTFAPETVIHLPCVKLDSQESEMEEVDTGKREGSMETQPESKEESLETEKIVISEQDQQEGNMLTEMKESEEWNNVDEKEDELTIPTSILSPLAKSVEAIVTPMRLVLCDLAEPIPFFQDLGQESDAHPAEETAPMYSIDAYRTLRRSAAYQSVTPVNRRKAAERALGSRSLNVKEKIKMLNGEIGTLQTIIQQASQALNCCTDEEHGKGSLEEAEAEKLLLVSCELLFIAAYQSVTPVNRRKAFERALGSRSLNVKEKIKMLNGEIGTLQTIIQQASQALNCCTDEEHGKGSLEEAEAEKLLLVSCELLFIAAYQSVTPVNRRKAFERALGSLSLNVKEKIKMLNGEIGTLQTIIQQASQALNCCTDEEHGKGSLEEAEAEKLLLVSSEKRLSLLSELSHLKGMGSQQQGTEPSTKEPCRGTLSISNLRLPLNVEFVSSALAKTGKPSHYFFVLIRYGSSNIVSTPLATAVDAQKGDTIAFPTSITLQDIHSNFEIDVEVYSLAKMGHSLTIEKRRPSKSKVPFLSPLEGNIHLRLECQIHSTIEHKGFLTMFEDVHGFGAWHRRWFSFNGKCVSYWNYPDDEGSKEAIGCINLTNCTSKEVESVKRDSCARPNTFELITARPQQKDNRKMVSQVHNTVFFKSWFSADTKEERAEWMEKLNQALLDLRTWQPVLSDQRPQQQGGQDGSSFSSSQESVL
ncbi:UNVERIFIED_CONTAM: hypothetical protein FKN15_068792 [Acipenser sinensis]